MTAYLIKALNGVGADGVGISLTETNCTTKDGPLDALWMCTNESVIPARLLAAIHCLFLQDFLDIFLQNSLGEIDAGTIMPGP